MPNVSLGSARVQLVHNREPRRVTRQFIRLKPIMWVDCIFFVLLRSTFTPNEDHEVHSLHSGVTVYGGMVASTAAEKFKLQHAEICNPTQTMLLTIDTYKRLP